MAINNLFRIPHWMIDTVNPLPRPKNLQGYFTRFSAFLQGNPSAGSLTASQCSGQIPGGEKTGGTGTAEKEMELPCRRNKEKNPRGNYPGEIKKARGKHGGKEKNAAKGAFGHGQGDRPPENDFNWVNWANHLPFIYGCSRLRAGVHQA
jgi:hypothetical protein